MAEGRSCLVIAVEKAVAGGAQEFVAYTYLDVFVKGVFQAGFSLIGEGDIGIAFVISRMLEAKSASHPSSATANVRGKAVIEGKFKDRFRKERILVEIIRH